MSRFSGIASQHTWITVSVAGIYLLASPRSNQSVVVTNILAQRQGNAGPITTVQWISGVVLVTPPWRLNGNEPFIWSGKTAHLFLGERDNGISVIVTGTAQVYPVQVQMNYDYFSG